MSTTDSLEREVKFAADAAFELPDLRGTVGQTVRLPEQSLVTSYFDTPDLRLWERGITLRHRRGEDSEAGTWTLKLPEGHHVQELERKELTWTGDEAALPPGARRILRGVVGRAPLGQIAVLESTRQRLSLHQQDGMALGEIDDDRVVVTAGRGEGLTFRQIELELGCADVSIVKKSLKRLRAAGAHPEGQQKLGKALGASGVAVPRPKVGRHAEVGAAVQHSLTDGCTRLLDQDYRLRREPSDPPVHAVHKARVACRRLRSDLQTFGPLLDPLWLQHVVADLRWLGVVLGHLRDSDVLSLRLTLNGDAAAMETGGLEELRGHLAQERRRSSRDLAEAMDSERYLRLVERLRTAAHAPPFSLAGNMDPGDPARVALPSLLLPRSKALRRRVRRAGHHPSDHDLHRIRIAAKRLRYGAEAASPVLGKPARRVARQAERLQVVLGEHHDAVAAEAWLRRVVRAGTGSAAFAAGLLVTSEQERQRHLRRRWERRWEAVYTSTQWLH